MTIKKLNLFVFYLIIIIYLEIVFKIITFNKLFDLGTLYAIIFAVPTAFFLKLISNFFGQKTNKVITFIFIFSICFLFGFHYIHYKFFSLIFSFYNIGYANQVLDFFDVLLSQIIKSWLQILLIFLPFISLIIFKNKLWFNKSLKKKKLFTFGLVLLTYATSLLLLIPTKNIQYGPYEMYFLTNDSTVSADSIGVITTSRIDLQRTITKFESKQIYFNDKKIDIVEEKQPEYNMVNIDFESLINNEKNETLSQMHTYFSSETPTLKNKYTGMYKGKNLIMIIAEGFNEIAVKENVTPTLYKLANEGFVFDNFYTPINLSTTGGEYQAMNSLVMTSEGGIAWKNGKKYQPYALGNVFGTLGYNNYAYHDWTYTYYKRNITMPQMGFSNYLAKGNGLEKLMDCNKWPPSDYEMVDVTTNFFLDKSKNDKPFVTYYFTVSGHTHYNWVGNSMAIRNKSLVQNLDYSETAKAYLATQIELDKALELLITRLTESGELENTVIALVGDHHPYEMATGIYDISDLTVINELSDRTEKKDEIIEINRSNFILWNPTTETKHITKISSQIDVLPTLLNLFGIEYDSRLLIGKDLLSEAPGLAIFSNRSWVSDYGKYYAGSRKFESNGKEISEDYVEEMNKIVSNKIAMSTKIMVQDYYRVTLGE